ncbi:MAG: hypothetical protein IPK99_03295 [Flavobacteriales bacterium]|nr:hypothetical protein [Flavobacteriales bacterium]
MEEFPLYRRSASGGNYYRIEAVDRFVEVQLVGSKVLRHDVIAGAYPERVLVQDMILCAHGAFAPIDAREFDAALARTS